tara:strand:+ start:338 stop:616 length:279 start_codon:yes stop_codon:yes gene_type:complete
MVSYIIKFQNTHVYAHLFEHNLVDLITKGCAMEALFLSNVFNYTFDFDEWPSTNSDTRKVSQPFNGSIFDLRQSYAKVFPDQYKADMEKEAK